INLAVKCQIYYIAFFFRVFFLVRAEDNPALDFFKLLIFFACLMAERTASFSSFPPKASISLTSLQALMASFDQPQVMSASGKLIRSRERSIENKLSSLVPRTLFK